MSQCLHLPSAHAQSVAPECALLAVLEATVAMARLTLLCKYPDIRQWPDEPFETGPPHLSTLVAELIVERCEEMKTLIDSYYQASGYEQSVLERDRALF